MLPLSRRQIKHGRYGTQHRRFIISTPVRALFREQEYSRFPVYRESLDNIAGFVFVKDLVALSVADDSRPITSLLRAAVVVPETKRVPELLKQFQRQQTQCALVVDEYGGTAGLVTIEDLLEEIVGEIRDEYDVESEPIVEEGDGRFVFNGKVSIDQMVQRLNVHVEREGFETVGGYLLSHLGRMPYVGERFQVDGLDVQVLEVERRRIAKVRLRRAEEPLKHEEQRDRQEHRLEQRGEDRARHRQHDRPERPEPLAPSTRAAWKMSAASCRGTA